jgi:hypothetical protein
MANAEDNRCTGALRDARGGEKRIWIAVMRAGPISASPSDARCTAWVRQAIAEHIHCHEFASGVERILGVLALAKKHGPTVVEDVGDAALNLALPTYRFVRRYLERRPPVPLALRQVDPHIRYLNLYRDFIDRTIRDPS